MAAHTPGPWRIVRSSDYTDDPEDTQIQSIQAADGTTVYFTDSGYFKPREADARLIAEAPVMATILRDLYPRLVHDGDGYCDDIRALLARIDGE